MRSTPRIPPSAAGLLAAWDAEGRGDHAPLEQWFRVGLPAIRDAVVEAGADRETADRIASELPDRLRRIVECRRPVRNELALLARCCLSVEIDLLRVDRGERRGEGAPEVGAAAGVRVVHFEDFAVPATGEEEKKLRRDYTVVEFFKIRKSGVSVPDCIFYRMPFEPETRCGLSSKVTTTVKLMVLVSGSAPDKSWQSGGGRGYYGKPGDEPDELGPPTEGKKTPDTAKFEPVAGQGDTTKTEKVLQLTPNHCGNWETYLSPAQGGGFQNKMETFASPGTWYVIDKGRRTEVTHDPEGGNTETVTAGSKAESAEGKQRLSVTDSATGMLSVVQQFPLDEGPLARTDLPVHSVSMEPVVEPEASPHRGPPMKSWIGTA